MIDGGIVRLPVGDLGASVRFYVETLGMKLVDLSEAAAVIDCGEGFLIALTTSPGGRPAVGLRPKMPLEQSRSILENRGIAFDEKSGFLDPDGNVLYLAPPP
jgi:catechol 2,3-dioxygenase-like lactoylglutathione lyase family enzyme